MQTSRIPLGGYSRSNGTVEGVDRTVGEGVPKGGGVIGLIFGLIVAITMMVIIIQYGNNM